VTYSYLLDTNVFVQAHRYFYPFDFVPGFWDWLEREHLKGTLASIAFVASELTDGTDVLADWARDRAGSEWFLEEDDQATQRCFQEVVDWVSLPSQGYQERVQGEFLSGADPWLIAKAKATGAIIVSHEKLDLQIRKKVLIPTVCHSLGVQCIDIYALMRTTGAKLALQ